MMLSSSENSRPISRQLIVPPTPTNKNILHQKESKEKKEQMRKDEVDQGNMKTMKMRMRMIPTTPKKNFPLVHPVNLASAITCLMRRVKVRQSQTG